MDVPPLAPPAVPVFDDNPLDAPLGVGDVLDGAFRLYRAHFGPLALSAAALLAPIGILSAIAVGPAQGAQMQVYRSIFLGGEAFDPAALNNAGGALAAMAGCCLAPFQIAQEISSEGDKSLLARSKSGNLVAIRVAHLLRHVVERNVVSVADRVGVRVGHARDVSIGLERCVEPQAKTVHLVDTELSDGRVDLHRHPGVTVAIDVDDAAVAPIGRQRVSQG